MQCYWHNLLVKKCNTEKIHHPVITNVQNYLVQETNSEVNSQIITMNCGL